MSISCDTIETKSEFIGRVCGTTLPDGHFCNQKHGHLGGCSLDANIEEIEPINPTAEPAGYEDPFDTYT
eukprot:scaffold85480_cov84-Phaeocystis_antarctica.AAC.1